MRRFVFLLLLSLSVVASGSSLPRRGTFGVPFQAMPEEVRTRLKLEAQEGIYVPSDSGVLKAGDVVISVGGKRFKSFATWADLVRSAVLQPSAKLGVIRDGKETTVEIEVRMKPVDKGENYETLYDDVVSNGHRIRTFVTRPSGTGKHPVLFWIQGINTGSVEAPLTGPGGMSRILKSFSDDGYVTVRVEKPGVGDSEGGPAALVGFNEEVDIYRQALKALDKYDFVDRDRVYVFGHSMGGCHAPIVCSEIPVRGIVTYGTVSDSWLEWQIKSARIQGPLGGKTRAQIDDEVRKTVAFYHYIYNEKRSVAWIKKNRPELRATAEGESPDGIMFNPRSIRYMQEVNDKNFCAYWPRVGKAKVLALFGENDWISIRDDQTQVALAVNAALPGQAVFKVVPASDHLFLKCTSMQDSFDRFGKPGAEFNPAIIDVMKDWIKSLG